MLRSSGVRIKDLALFYLHFTGGLVVSTFRAPTKWRSARGFKAPEIWRTVFQPDLLSRTNVQRGHLGKKTGWNGVEHGSGICGGRGGRGGGERWYQGNGAADGRAVLDLQNGITMRSKKFHRFFSTEWRSYFLFRSPAVSISLGQGKQSVRISILNIE
ncbi:uncharacterized protein BT62DRAFT_462719 [Guyanagaster necrorhizus]|uniref:Uncharacterized protein n=1 Tax=Guyanagaster necrorhizus TaxID=856835 RepID=A0A9P7VK05_9AGAR|nr:uncharacterized protein BT62DRAFT_462719 [Guyanagaster necrorhizus MCA 3950]KAG7441983.1 hypothetical protein BT62DRAFT_462719 [Guyanagaster necrorhizus MCA 3950]